MRGAFHDSLPEPAVKALREDRDTRILEGQRKDITVLACELRLSDDDFDRLQGDPDEVTKILAAASVDLRNTILNTGGAVDQAEGGHLYAYYNAPLDMADHVQAGCAAALRLIESMDKINSDLERTSHAHGVQVHLAIGIASGECVIGPMGHGRNNRYSAIGAPVARAAFLRRQSEVYGPAMICDETVYRKTHHHFAYLELDKLSPVIGADPAAFFALIGNPFIKSSKGFRDLDDAHRQFLQAYRAGDLATARANLDKAMASPAAKIPVFEIYDKRLKDLSTNGLPKNWDGVYRG